MHSSKVSCLLLASHAVGQTASTTTNSRTATYPSPLSTHAFEILTKTLNVDGVGAENHNNDGGKISPRDVCGGGIPVLAVLCPKNAYCELKPDCICPGFCLQGNFCTSCSPASVLRDAAGRLTTACLARETVYVVTGQARPAVVRTLSSPEASITAYYTSLTESTSPLPISESLPTLGASSKPGQAALQRGVVWPFTWLSKLMGSVSVRLARALPIRMQESSVAGRVSGTSLQSESTPRAESQSQSKPGFRPAMLVLAAIGRGRLEIVITAIIIFINVLLLGT